MANSQNQCNAVCKITDIEIETWTKSNYMEPTQMYYTQSKRQLSWDILRISDSIEVCLFNTDRKKLIFIKKFRPGAYYCNLNKEDRRNGNVDINKYPPELGFLLEFCSAFVNSCKSPNETAKEEIYNSAGYDVPLSQIEKVTSYLLNSGPFGNTNTLFYCEVTDEMKIEKGGSNPDLVELSIAETNKELWSKEELNCSDTFLFGILWFFNNKYTCTPVK